MKDKIIITLTIILTISIYYNYKFKDDSQKTFVNNGGVSFEQKQKCASYKSKIESDFKSNNNSDAPVEYKYFNEIFYSPKQDSCLYSYSIVFGSSPKELYKNNYLVDALTGKQLFETNVMGGSKANFEEIKRFDDVIQDFKN